MSTGAPVSPPESPWLRWLHNIEDGLLALLLFAMVVLASSQVILRNFLDSGFSWGDPLLRLLVLWLGLMGAMVATRMDRHITVDALLRGLPPGLQRGARALTKLTTAMVCALLAWHSGRLVALDYEYQDMLTEHVPAWIGDLILPVAFSVMTLRLTYQAFAMSRWRT
ncbi:MAG: TRAP transporter small permease subunit [Gammaproteobacteria bacterium]|nr:TRAP transporter small permease subunit [Gammaproteobacteria bacterium]